jgi:hypothetical protein
MKKTLLMLALVAGITSFAQNATAALIYNPSPGFARSGDVFGEEYNILPNPSSTGGGFTLLQQAAFSMPPFMFIPSRSNLSSYGASHFKIASFNDVVNASYMTSSFDSSDLSNGAGYYIAFDVKDRSNSNAVYYGWMNVTVSGANTIAANPPVSFILNSYAYDNTGSSILVGQTAGAAPIPEPGTWAAMAIFAGGAAYAGWRRRRAESLDQAA